MILIHYKVNSGLPEYLIYDALHCNDIGNLDPGVYQKIGSYETVHTSVEALIEDLELGEIQGIEIDISDVIEMLPDENMLNNRCEIDMSCNFLIKTYLGIEQIAVDKEAVFREMSLNEMRELFGLTGRL